MGSVLEENHHETLFSKDLRDRVVATIDAREGSPRQIARRFRVSLSF
jgi:hypothetical protein